MSIFFLVDENEDGLIALILNLDRGVHTLLSACPEMSENYVKLLYCANNILLYTAVLSQYSESSKHNFKFRWLSPVGLFQFSSLSLSHPISCLDPISYPVWILYLILSGSYPILSGSYPVWILQYLILSGSYPVWILSCLDPILSCLDPILSCLDPILSGSYPIDPV